jgi:hypothetical protein
MARQPKTFNYTIDYVSRMNGKVVTTAKWLYPNVPIINREGLHYRDFFEGELGATEVAHGTWMYTRDCAGITTDTFTIDLVSADEMFRLVLQEYQPMP